MNNKFQQAGIKAAGEKMKQIFRGPTAGKRIATGGFDVITVALCINSGQVMDEISVRCPIRTTDQKFEFRKVIVNIGREYPENADRCTP